MLVRLAVRYLNRSLPNPIPCVLDIQEVLVEDTEQPRFLPWEFVTNLFKGSLVQFFSDVVMEKVLAVFHLPQQL